MNEREELKAEIKKLNLAATDLKMDLHAQLRTRLAALPKA